LLVAQTDGPRTLLFSEQVIMLKSEINGSETRNTGFMQTQISENRRPACSP